MYNLILALSYGHIGAIICGCISLIGTIAIIIKYKLRKK